MSKKLIALFVVGMMLFYSIAAYAEQVTLAELKQQMPERLQMTVTTKDGKTIEVDAPIVLPDGETMPIVMVQRATFDLTDLSRVFPQNTLITPQEAQAGAISLWLYAEEKKNRLNGKVDSTTRAPLPPDATPPENNVMVEEIMAFIYENIERFDCDCDPDIRVLKATAYSGLYGMKKDTNPEGLKMYTINEKEPVKNGSKGMWKLHLAQYMRGARVFHIHYSPYGAYRSPENPNYWYSPFDFYVNYMDDKYYSIGICPAKEIDILVEHALLLSYDGLIRALEQRIETGHLKSIYSIELGYSVRIVKGDVFWDENYDFNPAARYVLVPEWQILGFDRKDAETAKSFGVDDPTRNMILDPERYCSNGYTGYELRMDAATGEFILGYESMEYYLDGGMR